MNVGQLIIELSRLDPSLRVILSEDEEGNGFHTLADLGFGWFDTEDGGHYYEDDENEFDELPPSAEMAVCLWP